MTTALTVGKHNPTTLQSTYKYRWSMSDFRCQYNVPTIVKYFQNSPSHSASRQNYVSNYCSNQTEYNTIQPAAENTICTTTMSQVLPKTLCKLLAVTKYPEYYILSTPFSHITSYYKVLFS